MSKIINYTANRLFYTAITTLVLAVLAMAQTRERVIGFPSFAIEGGQKKGGCGIMLPTQAKGLEVVDIKVKDKTIVLGQSFPANEDWLKNLSVKIKNVSDKPIKSISMSFVLPEAKYGEMISGFNIWYRDLSSFEKNNSQRAVLPGEEVVLTRTEAQYDRDSKVIGQRIGKTDFSQVTIGLTTAHFEDGMIWSSWKVPLQNQNLSGSTETTIDEPTKHRISGTVKMKSDGQPIAKALVQIISINDKATGLIPFTDCTLTDNQGRWTIDKVPDGQYRVTVGPDSRLSSTNYQGEKLNGINSEVVKKFVARVDEVKTNGADVTNLLAEVAKGGKITGKVIMEGGAALPKNLIVLPEQTAEKDRSPVRFAPVEPDGSFTLDGVPSGLIRLKAVVYGKPNEYYMKSATANSIDLLRETLKIEDGSEVDGVRVIFAKITEK